MVYQVKSGRQPKVFNRCDESRLGVPWWHGYDRVRGWMLAVNFRYID